MEWFTPVHFMLEMITYRDAQDRLRSVERIREANRKHRQEKLFLGADKEHPDGIYATAGHHLVNMTEDESRHW